MMKARPRVQGRSISGPLMNPLSDRGGAVLGGVPSTARTTIASTALSPSRRRQVMIVLKLVLVVQFALFLILRWRPFSSDSARAASLGRLAAGLAPYFTDEQEEQNSLLLQKMREKILDECRSGQKRSARDGGSALSKSALQWRSVLDRASDVSRAAGGMSAKSVVTSPTGPGPNNETDKCRFTFFDFGANVGDSLGKFISVGIPSCDEGEDSNVTDVVNASAASASASSSSTSSSFAGHTARTNRLVRWSKKIMADLGEQLEGRTLLPEHYCYIGIEGNPVFTSRLKQLQEQIVRVQPRPVKWAHFYTETVGAISNDPAVLYLDTKNADKNYWGSSTLYTHRDVQASANAEGQVYQAQVQGVTLTTLLRRHVLNDHGSHVLIKLDIEGSEYAVLNEAAESGILCELSAQAVQIDVMVEVHSKQVIGALDEMEYFRHAVKSNLERLCGVNLHLTMEAD